MVDTGTLVSEGGIRIMGKVRPPYPREFKEQIVALAWAGRSSAELAREFEPTERHIRDWIAQAKMAIFSHIEGWYNPLSRHSALDCLSPINYERKYRQEIQLAAQGRKTSTVH